MNILFVCKYNHFRSKAAEVFFKKYNRSRSVKVQSAGFIINDCKFPNIQKAAKRLGISISRKHTAVGKKLLREQDLVVIVADDVPSKAVKFLCPAVRVIRWEIPDAKKETVCERAGILREVRKKIKAMTELGYKK